MDGGYEQHERYLDFYMLEFRGNSDVTLLGCRKDDPPGTEQNLKVFWMNSENKDAPCALPRLLNVPWLV